METNEEQEVPNVDEKVAVLLDGLDDINITSLLIKYDEVTNVIQKTNELKEMLRNKIKVYLKEREWDNYMDERTKISVTILTAKRQSVDKTQLKIMLTDAQMSQVIRTTSFEKMTILTPEARKRLKKYVAKPK